MAKTRIPTLEERIAAASDRLTTSERHVARYIAEHGEEVAFQSAAEIAASVGTSDATVVRTAKALGYRGLPELKAALADALRVRLNPAARWARMVDALGDDPDTLLEHLITAHTELLAEARRSLQPDDFERALVLLAEAQRIVVMGLGPLRTVADYLTLTLRRIGRSTLMLTGRGIAFADELMELEAGDLLVVLAFEHLDREVEIALQRAAARRVPCVLITDHLALALEGRHTVALTARWGTSDTVPSVIVPLVIVEAMLFGLIGKDRRRAMAALDDLNRLRGGLGSS